MIWHERVWDERRGELSDHQIARAISGESDRRATIAAIGNGRPGGAELKGPADGARVDRERSSVVRSRGCVVIRAACGRQECERKRTDRISAHGIVCGRIEYGHVPDLTFHNQTREGWTYPTASPSAAAERSRFVKSV